MGGESILFRKHRLGPFLFAREAIYQSESISPKTTRDGETTSGITSFIICLFILPIIVSCSADFVLLFVYFQNVVLRVCLKEFETEFVVDAPLEAVTQFHLDHNALKTLTPPPVFIQYHKVP